MANKRDLPNVNVTLGGSGSDHEKLLGKEFPCPVCGAVMLVRLTFKQKPYCHCSSCVLQIFFRGKLAIQRLTEVIESGVLISGSDSSTHNDSDEDNQCSGLIVISVPGWCDQSSERSDAGFCIL